MTKAPAPRSPARPVQLSPSLPYSVNLGTLGYIEGLTISSPTTSDPQCRYFGGIPYALPPTGPYRYRRARPLPPHYTYGTKANPGRYTGGAALCPQPSALGPPVKELWAEDCLQLNVWVPAGRAPSGGWPVFFNIHGGFLQVGTANLSPAVGASLIGETAFKAIMVMPAYRLNSFGFLSSKELQAEADKDGDTIGNIGFWDQRMALEWTARNIGHFEGNADMITVGGYSAGSHATFHQLQYDLSLPDSQAIIKRAIMWSNGPGVQPKALHESQAQFDELLTVLTIPLSLPATEKLARLRAVPADRLIAAQDKLKLSEFRALTDNVFISTTLFQSINDGTFARKLQHRGIKLLNGECRDEHFVYGTWRTPDESYASLAQRLRADYPETAVTAALPLYFPDAPRLPDWAEDWADAFGKIYADMQVHALERGFADKLHQGGLVVGKDLLRYRIDWRAKCVDAVMPRAWKVSHSSDMAIWFWGNGYDGGLTADEKLLLKEFNALFAAFVRGEEVEWPVKGPKMMRRLNGKGETDMWEDERWEEGLAVWKAVNEDGGAGAHARL